MRGFNGGMDGSPNRIVIRAGTPAETEVAQTAFEQEATRRESVLALLPRLAVQL